MLTFSDLRFVPALIVGALSLAACDGSSDSNEVTVKVLIEGSGSGTVTSRSAVIEIDCRVDDGEVTGECEDVFVSTEGQGTIRLAASPSTTTTFEWGVPCRDADGGVCDIDFDAGNQNLIEVHTVFDAKTVSILMTPPNAVMTTGGEEGSIFLGAQAIDDKGAEVLGVVYTWDVDRPDLVSVIPQSDPRRVKVTALADGEAIVSATAQGFTGTTSIAIKL